MLRVEHHPGQFLELPAPSHRELGTGWAGFWRYHLRDGRRRRRVAWAFADESPAALQQALRAGAHPDMRLKMGSYPHDTLLGWAVFTQSADFAQVLLQAGADPNLPFGSRHASPLHQAALNGDEQMCDLLVAHGARWDSIGQDKHGNWTTALRQAHGLDFYPWACRVDAIQRSQALGSHLERALPGAPPSTAARARL